MKNIETKLSNYEIEKTDKSYILNLVKHIKSILRLQSELPQEMGFNSLLSRLYGDKEIKQILATLSDNPMIAQNCECLADLQRHYRVAADLAEMAETFNKLSRQINNYLKTVHLMAYTEAVQLKFEIDEICTPVLKSENIVTGLTPEQLMKIENT
jgi:hypothetical protein